MSYHLQSLCRLCSSSRLEDFFDLGEQALSGCFPGPGEADPANAPLKLCRCHNCQLVQLRHTTDPSQMFTEHYGYRSSLNSSMKDHLHELKNWITSRYKLVPNATIMDIGANDGTFLQAWNGAELNRLAIDPILDKFSEHYPDTIQQEPHFFTLELAQKLRIHSAADLITSISMFYDLPDLNNFVAGIACLLSEQGVWVLEQSYLPSMLANNSFDTICHEHLEYYALAQIEWLARSHGLKVLDVSLNDCNGGSFRVALGKENAELPRNIPAIERLRRAEEELALYTDQPYFAFTKRVEQLRTQTRSLLQKLRNEGKSVWLYGASTKGNVLLQHYGIDGDLVAGAVEVNQEKYGHRTPGSNISIRAEKDILEEKPDFFFVLPWHFKDNILARSDTYREAGVKFIFPLPSLEIIE